MTKKFFSVLTLAILAMLLSFQGAHAMTTLEFYRLAKKQKHIQPFAVTVQSACETGHWTSDLWKRGNNGAGLKVSSEWLKAGKPYITKSSVESRNGVYGKETSKFRKYNSPGEFLRDYTKKIRQDYPRCARNHDNIWGYFAGLYAGRIGKWATDHKYYEKL
ncbi:MAG: glucosaminidase domain-containing protein, partial [Synergistaceae bacterium]|nr:glucosaminidase domain-containing protein [Synergistaceae bacterium]